MHKKAGMEQELIWRKLSFSYKHVQDKVCAVSKEKSAL